ncbi:hypothetical protein H1P_10030 [Hyella patelloides LEGE 07179]|uniref:Uncharacterized protein n=1 Tax=Hyella patelloides LEGE 07179 TaxID=945734 RepID=A0A563VIS0_9CYAN|nr:hypothetical protein H1P_10030 [Hyella patelloides LEGE 07179]
MIFNRDIRESEFNKTLDTINRQKKSIAFVLLSFLLERF